MRPRELKPLNRTGIGIQPPELATELIVTAIDTAPPAGSAEAIAAVRVEYAREGEPPGSMPPPMPDAESTTAMRKQMLVFMDKLGERLGFERSGVRLYDALLSKYDAYGSWPGGPSRAELEEIRADEMAHFAMLHDRIEDLGGDPTAVTPSANLQSVIGGGLPTVLTDPRTDLEESMEAILVAELVDNDCWETLSDLAQALGRDELVADFEAALDEERDHLRRIRQWLGAALVHTAGVDAEPFDTRASIREALLGEVLTATVELPLHHEAPRRKPRRKRRNGH